MKNISTAQTSAEAPKYWTISYLHNANLILHSKAYSICNTSMWPAFNLTLLHQRKLFCPHLVKDTPPAWSAILSKISPTWAIIGSTVAGTISPWIQNQKPFIPNTHEPFTSSPSMKSSIHDNVKYLFSLQLNKTFDKSKKVRLSLHFVHLP